MSEPFVVLPEIGESHPKYSDLIFNGINKEGKWEWRTIYDTQSFFSDGYNVQTAIDGKVENNISIGFNAGFCVTSRD